MSAPHATRSLWLHRIDAATPAGRDRTIDAVRAVAIVGVVLGHWLVSAVVSDPALPARLYGASPLRELPALTPVTWLLQTLGLFFFAGGYATARSIASRRTAGRQRGIGSRDATTLPDPVRWFGKRMVRLVRPVLCLAAVWIPAGALLYATGAPSDTRHVIWSLVTHPLWFLLVYVVLTALAPLARTLVVRCGLWSVLPPLLVVAATDALRTHGIPGWLGIVDVIAGWSVPYLLGIALAEGRIARRRTGVALLVGGATLGTLLVTVAGYPASAVGVPGDGWSNLDPPSMFAIALAAAQIGLYLVLRPRLAGWLRRPARWAPVALLNLTAMTVFCWHQSALLLVSLTGLLVGRLPGLLDAPGPDWLAWRLLWLPVLALTLAALVAIFRRAESPRTTPVRARDPGGAHRSSAPGAHPPLR